MDQNLLLMLPNLDLEEKMFIENLTKDMDENRKKNFIVMYSNKRKDPQNMQTMAIVGLILVPGLQRFMLNQVGMGVLYLLTGGLCLIGSIMDLVNLKKMVLDYNKQQAMETTMIL